MKTKRYRLLLLLLSVFLAGGGVGAQDLNFDANVRRLIEGGGRAVPAAATDSADGRRDSLTDSEGRLRMSDRALFWSRRAGSSRVIGPGATFRDLVVVNPLFMPVLFRADGAMPVSAIAFGQPLATAFDFPGPPPAPARTLEREALRLRIRYMAYRYVQRNNMNSFRYRADRLPSETTRAIAGRGRVRPVARIEGVEADPAELPALPKFIPDRRYWTSSFASDIKFSQAYVSPNWHKGGTSNLNILARNRLQYDYTRDRMQLRNMVEINASVYTTANDTVRNYRLSEDMLRVYTNVGYRAFSKWFYTMDFEFKTPLFSNYQENTHVMQTALLSPFTVNMGVGMKYDLVPRFSRRDRSATLSLNLAPLSFSYMYSARDTIDLGRHGFPLDEATGLHRRTLSKFGSTLRFDMTLKPNRNVTWKSRLYYFTSYDRIVGEFENSLDLAISRYFSTLINLHLRYDDGVERRDDYRTFFQTNEVLSFGFSYRW
ncbi:MAG: DUF3078 domain-containing protein [Tannerella sp.]|jgi:hypothetical protein|nr:DUF3078 domain-containing protein [Tannerella sp.]